MKKKLAVIIIAAALVAFSTVTAFASGINKNEQAVLNKLSSTSAKLDGETVTLPASYINQAKNYMYTVDLTKEQCDRIIALIDEAKSILEGSGAKSLADVSDEIKKKVVAKANEIAKVLDMSLTQEKTDQGSTFTIKDGDGNVAFAASPKISKTGGITEGSIVKTTGSQVDLTALAAVSGSVAVITVAGCLYLIKKNIKGA
ncbi:MAG: hypothetical protein IJV39_03210 [Ruminococcus sp.]|nr:hypothetical protein [Ruminococcus sp.]